MGGQISPSTVRNPIEETKSTKAEPVLRWRHMNAYFWQIQRQTVNRKGVGKELGGGLDGEHSC